MMNFIWILDGMVILIVGNDSEFYLFCLLHSLRKTKAYSLFLFCYLGINSIVFYRLVCFIVYILMLLFRISACSLIHLRINIDTIKGNLFSHALLWNVYYIHSLHRHKTITIILWSTILSYAFLCMRLIFILNIN